MPSPGATSGASTCSFRVPTTTVRRATYPELQCTLEETQQRIGSHPARSTSTAEVRNDLIYIPYLDDERDAALLASTRVPDHFLQQIKFDRAVTTNFLATLLQALRK